MYGSSLVTSYRAARYRFFRWRLDCSILYKLNLAIIMACFTGLGAQIRIYTPFTPVPITGQVFFVLLSAVLLGKWWGGISQSIYVSIGLLGVPWFAPNAGMPAFSKGGLAVIWGPGGLGATGGYIIGFVVAAFVIGWILDTNIRSRKTPVVVFSAMLAGILIIHAIGALGLFIALSAAAPAAAGSAVITALILFIPLDLAKAIGVGAVSFGILPNKVRV
jgi:biotin transport system substrate-specific component